MNREEKLALLSGLSEEEFTKKFLIPLFQTMSYTLVDYSCGPLEIGKDLILLDEDRMHHRRYIAIQVKKGNIDTQKAKDIAFDICTAFGSTFKDLSDNTEKHFSEFIVINSGEVNEFARQQIFAFMRRDDLKRVVRFMDGPELTTLICEYRMDLLWDEYDCFKHYFEVLAEKFREIEDALTLGMRERPELEKLWVPVNFSESVKEEVTLPDAEEERMPALRRERQIKRKMKIEEALRTHRKFVIIGKPGSGKSTTLKHLCLKSIERNLQALEREVTPIFVILREFTESGLNFRDFINEILDKYGFPEASKLIEKDLENGKCLLLLDGFDELATSENQQKVKTEVERFIQKYPRNQVVVGSREVGYHGELGGFTTLTILDFDDEQIRKFATNRFGETDIMGNMVRAVQENENIKDLARNPLLLALISVIYEEDKKLPQRRADLYKKCLEVLLQKWDPKRGIQNRYEPEKKEFLLRELAFSAHSDGVRELKEERILSVIQQHSGRLDLEGEPEDILKEIWQRNGLLVMVHPGIYEFLHLSFQEYFAASKIEKDHNLKLVVEKSRNYWWREVILLYVGIMGDATRVIGEIRKAREDIFYSNLLLCGEMIAVTYSTEKSVRDGVIKDLMNLFEKGEYFGLKNMARRVLLQIGGREVTFSFIHTLKNPDGLVRRYAAEALGNIGTPDATEPLKEALKDPDVLVRMKAAEALGTPDAIELLKEALKDPNGSVRSYATQVLGSIGTPDAIELLKEALKDPDGSVRIYAAEALKNIRTPDAIEPLKEALKDPDGLVRRYAAGVLGNIRTPDAIEPLKEALKDPDGSVRRYAAEALGHIGTPDTIELLREALKDPNGSVRRYAAEALGHIGTPDTIEPLKEALKDPDVLVRRHATLALGHIGTPDTIELLREALKDPDVLVRMKAAEALGTPDAIELLREALKDPDGLVRMKAAEALGHIGTPDTIEPLKEALKDPDVLVRRHATLALGHIGTPDAIEPLREALKDPDVLVRRYAAGVLGNIRTPDAVELLKEALKDPDGYVRNEAFFALFGICKNSPISIYPQDIS